MINILLVIGILVIGIIAIMGMKATGALKMIEIFLDAPMELKVLILGSIFLILKELFTGRTRRHGEDKNHMDN